MNLFIDTHLNDVAIILQKGEEIIKLKVLEGVTENSKVIMPTIKKVLNKEKPESIIVVNGPGSFTGVRLGVTIAKTLAKTLNIPIRTISSLECMSISLDNDDENKVVAFSDNNGYYMAFFNNDNKKYGENIYVTKKEFEEFSNMYDVFTDVKLDYLKIIKYALTKKTVNPHQVNPIYIKKLDVEK